MANRDVIQCYEKQVLRFSFQILALYPLEGVLKAIQMSCYYRC
jgi:hypothetical protein